MNIIHISDLHFGPRHWDGDDKLLLEKINSYKADIVINTGDNTTDGLEDEYIDASVFLKGIKSEHVISINGNHDKRNLRSHELFTKYIHNAGIIPLPKDAKTRKKHIYLDRKITNIDNIFTDINFIKEISINKQKLLIISIDSSELYNDNGSVEKAILDEVSNKIRGIKHDLSILLTHYSLLGTDDFPLKNSSLLINFVSEHKIKYVFCGHTHQLDLRKTTDIYNGHSFSQFMCGTLSSCNNPNEDNMFLYYENFGENNMSIYLTRIFQEMGKLHFREEKVL